MLKQDIRFCLAAQIASVGNAVFCEGEGTKFSAWDGRKCASLIWATPWVASLLGEQWSQSTSFDKVAMLCRLHKGAVPFSTITMV